MLYVGARFNQLLYTILQKENARTPQRVATQQKPIAEVAMKPCKYTAHRQGSVSIGINLQNLTVSLFQQLLADCTAKYVGDPGQLGVEWMLLLASDQATSIKNSQTILILIFKL